MPRILSFAFTVAILLYLNIVITGCASSSTSSAPPSQQIPSWGNALPPSPPPMQESPEMAEFSWPPPRPSSFTIVDRADIIEPDTEPKLSSVENILRKALSAAGYVDLSWYKIQGQDDEFVLATRLEHIDSEAKPILGEGRWVNTSVPSNKSFTLSSYIADLFFAEAGTYRTILFAVTKRSFSFEQTELKAKQANDWVDNGSAFLSESVANAIFSKEHKLLMLVYEFKKEQGDNASNLQESQMKPGIFSADLHLKRSEIKSNFRKGQ